MKGSYPYKWMVIILLFITVSCEKDLVHDFFKRTGKMVTVDRPLSNTATFEKIRLNDDVNLVITQGTPFQIKLEGGENILPEIETSIDSNQLTISNKNKFTWMRSYKNKITAFVTLPKLTCITYNATSFVSNIDTIRSEDSLTISAVGGSGYINLTIKSAKTKLSILNKCAADMKVKGLSGLTFIYSAGYGPFYCDSLRSNFVFMSSRSTNNCYVRATTRLEYEILNLGDIIYYGNPSVSGQILGAGKLIKGD